MLKKLNEPHVPREIMIERCNKNVENEHGDVHQIDLPNLGWLKNGNPPGDFMAAPRCNAKSKRTGQPCKQPAMKNNRNGKCRFHGGRSTGPKTEQGLKNSQNASHKHGFYSQAHQSEIRQIRQLMKELQESLRSL